MKCPDAIARDIDEMKKMTIEVGGVAFNEKGWIKHTLEAAETYRMRKGTAVHKFGSSGNGCTWIRETKKRRWDGKSRYGSCRKLDPTTMVHMDIARLLISGENESKCLQKIDHIVKVGEKSAISQYKSSHGAANTLLHFAVRAGFFKVAKRLIYLGVDVNATRRKDGGTALHLAAWDSNPKMAKMLLDRKADPTIKNKYGELPPMWRLLNVGDKARFTDTEGSQPEDVTVFGIVLDARSTAKDKMVVEAA